ncbi:hypothetical protein PSM36_2047 [Proteiniphilum saccharofermentans]|jgi:hypothetical protein|uniref:Uncharacterized protein n=1 Tax=Proteiniphilum saccharofermentans TaxID=1642647 RepID=A0A1R3TB79_9BACT|nr:hypothetical protein PSM36_2047 [Proteiniphilum saccharofermentans]
MYGKQERKDPINIRCQANVHRDQKKCLFEEIVSIRHPYQNPAHLHVVTHFSSCWASNEVPFPASMAGS